MMRQQYQVFNDDPTDLGRLCHWETKRLETWGPPTIMEQANRDLHRILFNLRWWGERLSEAATRRLMQWFADYQQARRPAFPMLAPGVCAVDCEVGMVDVLPPDADELIARLALFLADPRNWDQEQHRLNTANKGPEDWHLDFRKAALQWASSILRTQVTSGADPLGDFPGKRRADALATAVC